MTTPDKISRVGFVVVKLCIQGNAFFLMRRSKKWNDISFIGGHENERDGGKLSRAAYRELLEEVPTLRATSRFELDELTNEFCYGPVHSRSANALVGYELQFFFLKFLHSPAPALAALGPKSQNMLVREEELLFQSKFKIADLVELLGQVVPGGLKSIPLSWQFDLASAVAATSKQQEFLHLTVQRHS